MKKIMMWLLVLVMSISLFSGCGKDAENEVVKGNGQAETKNSAGDTTGDTTSDSMSDEVVELVCYLENWSKDNDTMIAIIDQFQKDHPNIKLKIEETPDYETKVGIMLASGEPVDVIAVKNPVQFNTWASAGALMPLDELAANAGFSYEEAFGENANAAMYKDSYYSLPWQKTLWYLLYNKKHFDDAGIEYPSATEPMTWSEYKEIANQLTSGEGQEKVYGALNLSWPVYWYGSAIQTLGGGQRFYTQDGLSNIENPAFAKALQFAYDMQHIDESVPTYADITTQKIPGPAFFSGEYAMYVTGSWTLGWAKDQETYPRDWEIGVAPMPIPDETNQMSTWGVFGALAIPKTAENPVEAFTFLQYLSENAPKYGKGDLFAHNSAAEAGLAKVMVEGLENDGVTEEMVEHLFFNGNIEVVSEKITGENSTKYETIVNEEVEKYFVDIQELDETIQNIKRRADEIIKTN